MAQKGAPVGMKMRMNTLKGWARSLNLNLPLVPKPEKVKQRSKFKKRR